MFAGRRLTRLCAVTLAGSQWVVVGGHAQVAVTSAPLQAGAVVEREIVSGAPHRYELALAAGQFLDLVITDNLALRNLAPPDALEVTLRASAADASDPAAAIRRVSSETAPDGARRLCIVAETAETYSVTVASTTSLRYTLRVAEMRAATSADRKRHQALGHFVEAERLRPRPSPDDDRTAIPQYAAAAASWSEAGDRLEAAHVSHRLALAYAAIDEWSKALEADERAAALGRELGDARIEAAAVASTGITQVRMGDHPAALGRFERALALFRTAGDRDSEAYALGAIGVIYRSMGDADTALQYIGQAMASWKAVGNREGEALGLHVHGTALRLAGRFTEALSVLEETLRTRRELGHRMFAAAALAQIGHTHLSLGDVGRAFKAYEEALGLQLAIGQFRRESAGSAAVTAAAKRGDWPAAVELFAAGAGIFQAAGESAFQARLLHSPLRGKGGPEDARRGIEVLTKARPFLRAMSGGRWAAVADTAIANLFIMLGEPHRALEVYPGALETFRAIRDRDGEATALTGLALAEVYTGRLAAARDHAEAAVRVIESFQADVANPEIRTLYMSRNRVVYALYIEIEMLLERREPGRGHQATALLASERARVRGLLDLLHQARRQITAGVDPQLLAREQELTAAVGQAGERLTRLLTTRPKLEAVQFAERELNELDAELRAVQRQLQTQSPQYAALTQPPALDVAGIQRLLDDDTVLLEYSLGTLRSYVWVVTRDGVTAAVLPGRGDIETAARRAYDLLSRGARRDTRLQTRRALESLADAVIAPVTPLVGKRRIVIVADAGLHYVPFGALPKPGRPGAQEYGDPLIVEHEVVMLPSASALDALRRIERAPGGPERDLAVFADPVLEAGDARVRRSTRRGPASPAIGGAPLERLPYTRAEAKTIAALVPGGRALTALDFSARRATALAELGRSRLIHFATHALLDSNRPEQSGIVLSRVDPDGTPIDGFLRLHDVYNLRLNADLVVLSACRTALGRELRSEGLIGLTRGFFYAGAPAVVASLWDVRDRSTAALMTRFYRAMLHDRLAPSAALRAAQVAMLRDARWSAPAHWAGFVLKGDWRERNSQF